MKKEKWKRIKSHGRYLISSWGRVLSVRSEIILRPYIHKSCDNKYLRIEIDGLKYMVHVLVGTHFHGKQMRELQAANPGVIITANHKDRNTLNPNENNIKWETHSDNLKHFHETNWITFGGKTYKFTKEKRRH